MLGKEFVDVMSRLPSAPGQARLCEVARVKGVIAEFVSSDVHLDRMQSLAGTLRLKFEGLLSSNASANRGREFEKLLAGRLRIDGFMVHHNPRAATPRQTDLLGRLGTQDFLIEAKWRIRKIDVSDIASLRDRLSRTPSDFVGCLFNMSDYTEEAIREVQQHRTREILLFNAAEINAIFASRASTVDLIEKKRDELRVNASVFFQLPVKVAEVASPSEFPEPRRTIRIEGRDCTCVALSSSGEDVGFLLDFPVLDTTDSPTTVSLRLDAASTAELAAAFAHVQRALGLSENGSFSIHQRAHVWYGTGVANFLAEIDRWKDRYAAAELKEYHHSEELAYFDQSHGAMIALTARQAVGGATFIHAAELDITLPGIPVNFKPLQKLCEITGNEDVFFRQVTDECILRGRFQPKRIPLQAISRLISADGPEEFVSGLIARNPFRSGTISIEDSEKAAELLRYLKYPDHLVCELADWHLAADVTTPYILRDVQAIYIGHMPVLHVVATWEDYIKRTGQKRGDVSAAFERVLRDVTDVIDD
jgi:hypothetical protein